MADNLGPNGLVVSAGKCAGPIPAENCANAQKIHPAPSISEYGRAIIFRVSDFLLTIEVSTFSGQVSAIEARDAAIFTRNIED